MTDPKTVVLFCILFQQILVLLHRFYSVLLHDSLDSNHSPNYGLPDDSEFTAGN